MKVVKFGGTSVADAKQILKIVDIVKSDPCRRIVVVSAPGKRHPDDTKVTDMLIALANDVIACKPYESDLAAVVERYAEIQREMGLDAAIIAEIEQDLKRRIQNRSGISDPQFLDTMKAAGEDNSAKLVAQAFIKQGFPARYVDPRDAGMLLSEDFGNAQVLPESYDRLACAQGRQGHRRSSRASSVTPSRAMSRPSPAAAPTSPAPSWPPPSRPSVYENFTDVDSVFAIDPRIVPDGHAHPDADLPRAAGTLLRRVRRLPR